MKTQIYNRISADITKLPSPTPEFVVVSGSWHDMGVQYAQQAREQIMIRVAEMLGNYIDIFGSYEDVVKVVSDFLAPSRADFPQLIELLEGMGEELSLAPEVCAILLYGMSMIRVELESRQNMDSCSHSAAWGDSTTNGHLLTAANVDMDTTTTNYLPCILAYPDDGIAYICGENFHRNGMNEEGLILQMSGGQNAGKDGAEKGEGRRMWNDSEIKAFFTCKTTAQALEVYKNNRYVVGCNQFIGDLSHDTCIIEFTANRFCVRRPGDYGEKNFIFATNGYNAPELQANLAMGPFHWNDCLPRYWTIERILQDNDGKIDLDILRRAEGCYNFYIPEGWSFVKHEGWDGNGEWVKGGNSPYPAGWHEGPEAEFGQWTPQMRGTDGAAFRFLMDAEERSFYVMKGESSPVFANTPGATGTFAKVTLGGRPEDVVARAKAELNRLLEKAEFDTEDVPPAAWSERITNIHRSREHLLKGITAYGMALCAGSMTNKAERNYYLGKALSEFGAGQCVARLALDDPELIML